MPAAVEEPTVAAVVVLAAGQGTRMRSSTPKVLHALGGRSLLGHVLAAAEPLRAGTTVVVVGAGREAVEEHLARPSPPARCPSSRRSSADPATPPPWHWPPCPTSRGRSCSSTGTRRCCGPRP